jgi:hypothetical protein
MSMTHEMMRVVVGDAVKVRDDDGESDGEIGLW